MKKLVSLFTLFSLFFLIAPPATIATTQGIQQETQEEDPTPHPLLEMLRLVPFPAPMTAYIDIRAMERGVLNPVSPRNFRTFELSSGVWTQASRRISISPPDVLSYFMVGGPEMPEVVGFDFFTIDRALSFGIPPEMGLIFNGEFDLEAVAQAHAGRDYIEKDIAGLSAWCGNDDCDGTLPDFNNRNPANVFDPALGRLPGVYLLAGNLASAFDPALFNQLGRTIAGQSRSLVDSPAHAAIARALTDPSTYPAHLVQVQFLEPETVAESINLRLFESYEDYQAAFESFIFPYNITPDWLNYGELPAYQLAALADYHDGEATQTAIVLLAYANAQAAAIAADELRVRLEGLTDPRSDDYQPFIEQIEGAVMDAPYVYTDEASGYAVAVASVSYPMVEASPQALTLPGAIFRFWVQLFYQRAFSPLWYITLGDWLCEVDDSC